MSEAEFIPQELNKTFRVARDNNPSLIRAVLTRRGYLEQNQDNCSADDQTNFCVQWAQNAFGVDWGLLEDKSCSDNSRPRGLANQLPTATIGTKEGMLAALRHMRDMESWFGKEYLEFSSYEFSSSKGERGRRGRGKQATLEF